MMGLIGSRTHRISRSKLVASVLLTGSIGVFGACQDPPLPKFEGKIVFQYDLTPGFTTAAAAAASRPVVTVYDDGRVFFRSTVQTEQYPQPAMQPWYQIKISNAGLVALRQKALDAGVGTVSNIDSCVADAGGINLLIDSKLTHVVAPGVGSCPAQSTDVLRAKLIALADWIDDPEVALAQYMIEARKFAISPGIVTVAEVANPAQVADVKLRVWPSDLKPIGGTNTSVTTGDSYVCDARFFGDFIGTWITGLVSDTATLYQSGNKLYRVTFYTLLPHETGCVGLN